MLRSSSFNFRFFNQHCFVRMFQRIPVCPSFNVITTMKGEVGVEVFAFYRQYDFRLIVFHKIRRCGFVIKYHPGFRINQGICRITSASAIACDLSRTLQNTSNTHRQRRQGLDTSTIQCILLT